MELDEGTGPFASFDAPSSWALRKDCVMPKEHPDRKTRGFKPPFSLSVCFYLTGGLVKARHTHKTQQRTCSV